MGMSLEAQRIWSEAYIHELTREREGLFGAITGRAHAISLRMAVLFAALDGSHVIEGPHVEAALATWKRSEASAAYLFGGSSGDPFADRVKKVIVDAGPEGIRRGDIRDKLGSHNFDADRIVRVLENFRERGEAHTVREDTKGRPAERWVALDLPPIPPITPTGGA